jgi:4'-phosphopantetheinyl transferase
MPQIHLLVRDLAAMALTKNAAARNVLIAADYQQLSSRRELRERQLLMRAFRRRLLAEILDCDSATLIFSQTADGKPWLPQHRLSFNLSHSRNALALAWSYDGIALGVDIEDRERRLRMSELAAHCFSAAEMAAWETQGCSKEQWLLIWTRKEALLKCAGIGLRMALPEVDTGRIDRHGNVAHEVLLPMGLQSWQLAGQVLSLAWARTDAGKTGTAQMLEAAPDIVLDAGAAEKLPARPAVVT